MYLWLSSQRQPMHADVAVAKAKAMTLILALTSDNAGPLPAVVAELRQQQQNTTTTRTTANNSNNNNKKRKKPSTNFSFIFNT